MQDKDSFYIGMDEVIETACSTISGVTSADKLFMRQWLGELILPELGLSEEDIKVVTLYPTHECTVVKPDDLKCIIDIELYDAAGCYLKHKYNAGVLRIIPDARKRPSATVGASNQLNSLIPVDVSSNAHSLYFGTNGDKVAYVVLRYWAYPTDVNGLPMIKENETLACVLGLRYWWEMKHGDSISAKQDARIEYFRASDKARAGKKALAFNNENMKKIMKQVWMRSIPNFNITGF